MAKADAIASATAASSPSAMGSSEPPEPEHVSVRNLDSGVTGRTDPRFANLGLFDKLLVEKTNRPPNTLKAETVFDAITSKLGLKMVDRKQLAAWPVMASYCEKADTEINVNVSVCEFTDDASFDKGKALAEANKVPRREIVKVKTSWVSITRFPETKEGVDQAKRISDLVKTL